MERKATYQLSEQVIEEVRSAVSSGAAASMGEFVEQALRERLKELQRTAIWQNIHLAADDRLYLADVHETTEAYSGTHTDGMAES
jgi:Arc/MetJ-type ribon-helix-helix transcriptional regulator